MTRISSVSKPGSATPATKSSSAGGDFSVEGQAGPNPSSSADALAPASTLSALIALQSDPAFRDGRGNAKTLVAAQQVLGRLERLQQALLSGSAPADTLQTLQEAAALRAHAGADPALLAIFDEITLRARVELAKLGR